MAGLCTSIGLNATGVGASAPWMPVLVGPAVLALVAGVATTAVRVVRSGTLPRATAAGLAITALALAGANEQTATAWLAVPFGLAWVSTGVVIRRRPAESPQAA